MNDDQDLTYRDGFDDALRWVKEVFNLDMEDELEIERVLEGGDCEGRRD